MAAPQTGKSRTLLWVTIGGGAFFLFLVAIITLIYYAVHGQQQAEFDGFGDKIGVIEVQGVILDSREFVRQLRDFEKDDSIKAIVLQIDSPGGGAAASQEMYDAVKSYRDQKRKPIVASISTVGASGAYYLASGTNKIFADNASIVGSIGVIAQWVNYGDLLRWLKLKDVTLKAGSLKDAGNPARDMTPAEQAYLQGLIDNMHSQFIHDVAVGRGIKEDDLRPIATGQVWTGQQALPLKLIDKIGTFQDAVDDTAKSVGIKGEPEIVRPEKKRRSLFDIMFNDASDLIPDRAKLLQQHVGIYCLWK